MTSAEMTVRSKSNCHEDEEDGGENIIYNGRYPLGERQRYWQESSYP
jgi:hypothetical protein